MKKPENLSLAALGLQGRTSPGISRLYSSDQLANLSDEQIGMRMLEENPKYWQFISPPVRRLHGLMQQSFQGGGFFDETRVNNTKGHIENAIAEGVAINEISVIAAATARNLPTELYKQVISFPYMMEMRKQTAAVDIEIDIGRKNVELGYKAATNEIDFEHHEKVETLKVKTTLDVEKGRLEIDLTRDKAKVENELTLYERQAEIDLKAAEIAEKQRLGNIDAIREKLAYYRQQREEILLKTDISENHRHGLLADLQVMIEKYEEQLRAA